MSSARSQTEQAQSHAQLALAKAMLRVLVTRELPTESERIDLLLLVRGVVERADVRW